MIKSLCLLTVLLLFGVSPSKAQEGSVSFEYNESGAVISKYNERLSTVKADLSAIASELSDIVKCYQQRKVYTSSGCSAATIFDPETDPYIANHADKVIPTTCASNEVQDYSGSVWSCKTIRYLCSNPSGC